MKKKKQINERNGVVSFLDLKQAELERNHEEGNIRKGIVGFSYRLKTETKERSARNTEITSEISRKGIVDFIKFLGSEVENNRKAVVGNCRIRCTRVRKIEGDQVPKRNKRLLVQFTI